MATAPIHIFKFPAILISFHGLVVLLLAEYIVILRRLFEKCIQPWQVIQQRYFLQSQSQSFQSLHTSSVAQKCLVPALHPLEILSHFVVVIKKHFRALHFLHLYRQELLWEV